MTAEELKDRLKAVKYPGFTRDIVSFGVVKEIEIHGDHCHVRLSMITENTDVVRKIVDDIEALLADIPGLPAVDVVVERPKTDKASQAREMAGAMGNGPSGVPGVGRLVAVASGKGGVGKSTVAANLAAGLAAGGARVGLLDCDIYGPSVPTMFGVRPDERAGSDEEGRFLPLERHGVRLCSMGFFVSAGAPLIWRGPMLGKALGQFIGDVAWGELDYLVLDLPPGTGDIQMTLTQKLKMDAGIIVTTPQDVALADVERGIKMFQQAGVPVLGVVENMSFWRCSDCGEESRIFGDGGGLRVASRFGVPLLASIPLERRVREGADAGTPVLIAEPTSDSAKAFAALVERVGSEIPAEQVVHA
ncbi:MAG: ATP-binding protein involved in chromosome partitioning [Hyphomicrobiaceae bacterium]|jgi:ATP-binding protein involved in chromosome partitioning